MNEAQIREALFRSLRRVAPEVDGATLDPARRLRDQVEIDSMDFLNFVIEVHRELGVDVPETDYGRMETVDSAVAYVAERLASRPPTA